LANAEALENTLEQTLHDCGDALLPEEDPDFLGVAGEDDVGVLGFVCCDPPDVVKLGLGEIVVCDGLTNGVEELDMLLGALWDECTDSLLGSVLLLQFADGTMEEVVTTDAGADEGMEILIVVFKLD
jgi:hypothetical protein